MYDIGLPCSNQLDLLANSFPLEPLQYRAGPAKRHADHHHDLTGQVNLLRLCKINFLLNSLPGNIFHIPYEMACTVSHLHIFLIWHAA